MEAVEGGKSVSARARRVELRARCVATRFSYRVSPASSLSLLRKQEFARRRKDVESSRAPRPGEEEDTRAEPCAQTYDTRTSFVFRAVSLPLCARVQ